MNYVYVGVVLLTAVVWVSALVCVILAGIRREPAEVLLCWIALMVVAVVANRIAGSLLKQKMDQHDKTKEKESDAD